MFQFKPIEPLESLVCPEIFLRLPAIFHEISQMTITGIHSLPRFQQLMEIVRDRWSKFEA